MATTRQQNLDKVGTAVKNWNQNPVRPVYISPDDRRAPRQVTNVPATPAMTPATFNNRLADVRAGKMGTVPFSDPTADAAGFFRNDLRTASQKATAPRPPVAATPQDKAMVLTQHYKDSLMPTGMRAMYPGGSDPVNAPASAQDFLNQPAYDMDYATLNEMQKTREGRLAVADMQERQRRFKSSIVQIATQMGVGSAAASDAGLQEWYDRAIATNPEYSPIIAGYAKDLFMKTMPDEVRRKMAMDQVERGMAESDRKGTERLRQAGITNKIIFNGREMDLPEQPEDHEQKRQEAIQQMKRRVDEINAGAEKPIKRLDYNDKGDPVIKDAVKQAAPEDTFPGTKFYENRNESERSEIRRNIADIEGGLLINPVVSKNGRMVLEEKEQIDSTELETAKKLTARYKKRFKADDEQQQKSYLEKNADALMNDMAIEPVTKDEKTGLWSIRYPDASGKMIEMDGIPLPRNYVMSHKAQTERR